MRALFGTPDRSDVLTRVRLQCKGCAFHRIGSDYVNSVRNIGHKWYRRIAQLFKVGNLTRVDDWPTLMETNGSQHNHNDKTESDPNTYFSPNHMAQVIQESRKSRGL